MKVPTHPIDWLVKNAKNKDRNEYIRVSNRREYICYFIWLKICTVVSIRTVKMDPFMIILVNYYNQDVNFEFHSIPKKVKRVVGPSILSGAKGMPMSTAACWIARNDRPHTGDAGGPSVR